MVEERELAAEMLHKDAQKMLHDRHAGHSLRSDQLPGWFAYSRHGCGRLTDGGRTVDSYIKDDSFET